MIRRVLQFRSDPLYQANDNHHNKDNYFIWNYLWLTSHISKFFCDLNRAGSAHWCSSPSSGGMNDHSWTVAWPSLDTDSGLVFLLFNLSYLLISDLFTNTTHQQWANIGPTNCRDAEQWNNLYSWQFITEVITDTYSRQY